MGAPGRVIRHANSPKQLYRGDQTSWEDENQLMLEAKERACASQGGKQNIYKLKDLEVSLKPRELGQNLTLPQMFKVPEHSTSRSVQNLSLRLSLQ